MPHRATTVLPPASSLRTWLGLGLLTLLLACRTAAPEGTQAPAETALSLEERLDKARNTLKGEELKRALDGLTPELERAVARAPRDAHLHYLLGRVYFYAERDEEAGRAFDTALELAPEVAEYHFLKGFYLRFRNDLDGSLAELTRATELDPKEAKYWSQLGATLEAKGQQARALETYERALSLDAEAPVALAGSGRVLLTLGREEEALARMERAARHTPDDVTLHYNLGQHFQTRGDHPRSLKYFQAVVALAPDDWHARAKCIQEHQALGQTAERDAQLTALRELRKQGKVPSPFFVREQFTEAGEKVMVFEHFELEGPRAVRYRFEVLDATGKDTRRTLSLGSYAFTNDAFKELGSVPSGVRVFHLDGYFPDSSHQTFAFFNGEPSYEDTRALVVEVLHGRLKPASETRINRQP